MNGYAVYNYLNMLWWIRINCIKCNKPKCYYKKDEKFPDKPIYEFHEEYICEDCKKIDNASLTYVITTKGF